MSFFFFYTLGCGCFVSFILWFFFFSSEWWFCFIVLCVKSFELVVFIDSECDFICFGFLLYRLKECGFENLNNPLFGKPKTDRNRWFSNHFDRFRLRISQTEIFGFGWPYPYKPTETEPSTPPHFTQCYYWHFRPSETKAQMDLKHCQTKSRTDDRELWKIYK